MKNIPTLVHRRNIDGKYYVFQLPGINTLLTNTFNFQVIARDTAINNAIVSKVVEKQYMNQLCPIIDANVA